VRIHVSTENVCGFPEKGLKLRKSEIFHHFYPNSDADDASPQSMAKNPQTVMIFGMQCGKWGPETPTNRVLRKILSKVPKKIMVRCFKSEKYRQISFFIA
jgi:hypothetical protein